MRLLNENTTIAACLAAFLLTACATEASDEPTDSQTASDGETAATLSAESLEMAETAWLTVSEDGEVFTTYLDGDGRYRDERGGELAYTGSWEQNTDGELCFSPDEGAGGCWSHRSPGLDGVMRATSASGRAIEVKRVAYTPPPSTPGEEPEEDAPGGAPNEAPDEAPDEAPGSGG